MIAGILAYLITACGIAAFFFMWIWYVTKEEWCVIASLYSLIIGAVVMIFSMVV